MAKNTSRSGRMGDLIQRELSRLIREDFTAPTYGMITVSSVIVTDDFSFARVYITVLDDAKQQSTLDALNNVAGYFRTQIAKKLTTRITPKIKFIYDTSLNVGSRIDQLLSAVTKHDDHKNDDSASEAN